MQSAVGSGVVMGTCLCGGHWNISRVNFLMNSVTWHGAQRLCVPVNIGAPLEDISVLGFFTCSQLPEAALFVLVL